MTVTTPADAVATAASVPWRNRTGRVIALIPAHNEADWIERVVANLLAQTCPPERIVVMSDNSADATVAERIPPAVYYACGSCGTFFSFRD